MLRAGDLDQAACSLVVADVAQVGDTVLGHHDLDVRPTRRHHIDIGHDGRRAVLGAGAQRDDRESADRPVHIWSGLVTDETAALHGRGLLLGPVVAAYTWGGEPIRALAAAGLLRLRSSTITHDLSRLSATPRFVSCNTALQVGLDGSVNLSLIHI